MGRCDFDAVGVRARADCLSRGLAPSWFGGGEIVEPECLCDGDERLQAESGANSGLWVSGDEELGMEIS